MTPCCLTFLFDFLARLFECVYTGCSKLFCSKSHLTRHELTHTKEKPFSFLTEMAIWITLFMAFGVMNLSLSVRGDVWTSQTPANSSDGGKSWSNFAIFGNVEGATSSDYKNPGYYGITAEDVAVWHVPNDKQLDQWKKAAFLRYHTENSFLTHNGKTLYNLFNLYPLKEFGKSKCVIYNGPYAPVVYDTGNGTFNQNLYGPISRDYTAPVYIMLQATNLNGTRLRSAQESTRNA
ncbi:intelectin-like, partial [Clarias magur]